MDFSFLNNEKNVLNAGASQAEIKNVQTTLNISFPQTLFEFLMFADGGVVSDRVILFSCKNDAEETLLNYNNSTTVSDFLRIGRFSSDEFGYKREDISGENPPIYVIDHETNEFVKEADSLLDFLKKYNNFKPKKKKWYSFLFQ